MIEYGSDYLLGLATLAPEKFGQRDRLWESGDAAYYEVSHALQYLGNVVFRNPVPAYKHSAAVFLQMCRSHIQRSNTSPQSAAPAMGAGNSEGLFETNADKDESQLNGAV